MLTVRVRDLDNLGNILDLALQDGANQISGLRFDLKSPEPLEEEARALAVKDAMAQAGQLAEAAGVKLGKIRTISTTGGGGHYATLQTARLGSGVPVASGEVTVDAQVSMTFDIAQ
jgi:uncharacterized protein YggE